MKVLIYSIQEHVQVSKFKLAVKKDVSDVIFTKMWQSSDSLARCVVLILLMMGGCGLISRMFALIHTAPAA